MEKIKRSYDDLHNKIRPGTTWVAAFTQPGNNDDLRSIDSDGSEMRFIPESRYYASCKIKRGQAVSIAQLEDLSESQANNKYAYVKITDPDVDDTCLGIAMNYAEPNQIVQIQRKGKFNYLTTDSILNTEENRKYEIFLNAKGWTYDEVRGQKLFIKKLYENVTQSGKIVSEESDYTDPTKQVLVDENKDAFDTDHADESVAADNSDWFTYDFYDSIYNARNTIQIGYLTDAPTTDVANKGYFIRSESQGEVHFYDSDNQKGEDVFGDKAVVVEYNKSTGKIEIVDGSGPIHEDGKQNWWEELKAEGKLPKANEAIWLVKGEIEVDVEIAGKLEKRLKTVYSPVDDQVVTIELDITGDTRGPIDNTQFVLNLGETIYFDTYKHDVDYNELDADKNLVYAPHYNAGIYDELKVVAIAKGNPRSPSFRIFNKTSVKLGANNENELNQGFIAVRKLDGDTYIIPVLTHLTSAAFEETVIPALIDVNDEGYFKLSKQFSAGEYKEYVSTDEDGNVIKQLKRADIKFAEEPLNEVNRDSLRVAIKKALKAVYRDDETGSTDCETTDYDIGDNGFFLTTNKVGGYYDIYISSEVLNIVSATEIDHGQFAKAGEAILADIRDSDRLNIAGVVLSNQSGYRKRGETVKVMKIGRIVTLGNLLPGEQYFLGLNGRITAKEQFWYDHSVSIGTAESSNYFIVNVNPHPQHSYSGNFPLGYIKPSVNCRPEQGYLLADGITLYSKQAYPELYKLLLNWFDEEELKPSNITEDLYTRYRETQVQSVLDSLLELYQETAVDLGMLRQEYQNKILEIKSTDDLQSSRLNSIESLDKTQNERLNKIEALNELQSSHLTQHDEVISKQAADLSSTAAAIRQEESERAAAQQILDDAQTAALNAAKEAQAAKNQEQDTAFEAYKTSQKADLDAYKAAQEKINSAQDAAIEKAEEWQDENHDNKSLQTYIADIVQKELNDITNMNASIAATKDELAKRLGDAENALKETQEKNEQLEGLLRVYAAATAKETVFNPFTLGSINGSSDKNETFTLFSGSSINLSFTVEDDPNWRTPAYSELLFNGKVFSNDLTYSDKINSNLIVKHVNTLTGKESPTKTIKFVDPVKPNTNPTSLSWLTVPENGGLKWTEHLPELTAAADNANKSNGLSEWSLTLQYSTNNSTNSSDWQVFTPNLATMFGGADRIYLRVRCTIADSCKRSEECIINLGSVAKGSVSTENITYKITSITSTKDHIITDLANDPSDSLSGAFNGSFNLRLGGEKDSIAYQFQNETDIVASNATNQKVFIRSPELHGEGTYLYQCQTSQALYGDLNVKVDKFQDTQWSTVQ